MARPIRINRTPCIKGRNKPITPKPMKNQPMISNPILLIVPNGKSLSDQKGVKLRVIIKGIQSFLLLQEGHCAVGQRGGDGFIT